MHSHVIIHIPFVKRRIHYCTVFNIITTAYAWNAFLLVIIQNVHHSQENAFIHVHILLHSFAFVTACISLHMVSCMHTAAYQHDAFKRIHTHSNAFKCIQTHHCASSQRIWTGPGMSQQVLKLKQSCENFEPFVLCLKTISRKLVFQQGAHMRGD